MNRCRRWPLFTAFASVALLLIQSGVVAADEPSRSQSVGQPVVFSASQIAAAIGLALLAILALLTWAFKWRRQVVDQTAELSKASSRLDDMAMQKDVTANSTASAPAPASPASPQQRDATKRLAKEITHDFSNMLTVINCSLLTVSENTGEECNESIEVMELATTRVAKLAKQLQGFATRARLDQKRVAVDRLLENVYSTVNSEVEATAQFRMVNCEANEFFVDVDDEKLQQSLVNLCRYAHDGVKAGGVKEAGGELTLSVTPCDHPTLGQCVCINVKDNGERLSDEDQARIFEPYVTTQGGEGAGLGLAYAHGVVEQHGGEIRVESEIGKYTEFQIVLPRCVSTVSEAGSDAMEGKRRILVVDDDELIRESLALLLEELHHTAVIADGGAQAISLLTNEPPFDVVLLDLTMPGMSGIETYQEIRSEWPNLRVVFCSGYSSDWSGFDAITAESPEVLSKPVQAESLEALFS